MATLLNRNDSGPSQTAVGARLAMTVAVAVVVLAPVAGSLWSVRWGIRNPYHLANAALNYFEFGAVRRGFAGSLIWLSGRGLGRGLAIACSAAVVTTAVICTWLLLRRQRPIAALVAFVLVLAAVVHFLVYDLGRLDSLVALSIVVAAVMTLARHPVLAGMSLIMGLFVEELAFIFGAPLFLALAVWHLSRRQTVMGLGVLALGALAYVLFPLLPHVVTTDVIASLESRFSNGSDRFDLALYHALSGSRGLRTAMCMNFNDPLWPVHGLVGAIMICMAAFALAAGCARSFKIALLAGVIPFAFMWVVGNDMIRWTAFSLLNVWLVALRGRQVTQHRPGLLLATSLCALTIFVLHSASVVRVENPYFTPSPLVDEVVRRLGGPVSPTVEQGLARCDPAWREFLTGG
jgi:hypothetical protein